MSKIVVRISFVAAILFDQTFLSFINENISEHIIKS